MTHGRRVLRGPRWLLPALVVFLVLGHVCELPAYAAVLSHATAEAHHADHHGDEAQMSCDAVDAVSNSGSLHVVHVLHMAPADLVDVAAPIQRVSSMVEHWTHLRSRPPLFVLYASLLI